MDKNKSGPQPPQSGAKPGFMGSFGGRALIHCAGLLALGSISGNNSANSVEDSLAVGIYFGIICILHRGVWREAKWYLSTITGLVQAGILVLLGMPLVAGIFWGGVQTWLQRLIQKEGHLGLEWAVSPFLIMAASDYFDSSLPPDFQLWPLYSLLAVAPAGLGLRLAFERIRRVSLHRDMLAQALQRLQACSSNDSLEGELQKQVTILLSQTPAIEQAGLQGTEAGRKFIVELEATSLEIERLLHAPQTTRGGWSRALFRGQTWNKAAGQGREGSPVEALRRCNAQLMELLRGSKINEGTNLDPLAVFEQQARRLVCEAQQAPPQIATQLESIGLLALEIVKSMRDDPRDRPGGERFLQRYLPAASHIAEEYTRLAQSNNPRHDVAQAISRGEEVLSRLHKAFKDELAAMLANDSASFTAELNALDKLLQMSGH